MKYCVLIQTELADAKYDYFEKPVFFDDKQQALDYIDLRITEISSYPASISPLLLSIDGGFYENWN